MAWKSPTNNLALVALITLSLTLAGCASKPATPGDSTARFWLPNSSQASVNVDASSLPAVRLQAFKLHGGAPAFAEAISTALMQAGSKLRPEATEMRVEVTRFRLRSTSTGFWIGAMAGADILEVRVTLRQGEKNLSSYSTGAQGLVAGIIKPSAGGRFQGLIKLVAERIVQKLGSIGDSVGN